VRRQVVPGRSQPLATASPSMSGGANGSVRLAGAPASREPSRPVVARIPYRIPRSDSSKGHPRVPRPVPEVRGLETRDAVRTLHEAGFRVHIARGPAGVAFATSPAAGTAAPAGTLVRLTREP
jgi:hypothetical protein